MLVVSIAIGLVSYPVTMSPSFHDTYLLGEQLSCGSQACTWKVTQKKSGEVYLAKIYKNEGKGFKEEKDAMNLIGSHEGY